MTTQLHTAAKQALDALEWLLANIRRDAPQLSGKAMGNAEVACTALRSALASPMPEPIGEVLISTDPLGREGVQVVKWADNAPATKVGMKLYAAPPAPQAEPPTPVPDGMVMVPNPDEVICPNCAHEFRAIPINVQLLLLDSGHEPPFLAASPATPVVREPQPETSRLLANVADAARRLVEHADFQLGGILSADSKAKDIPSKAVSQVKARHLASLRDRVAELDAANGITGGSK